MTRLESAIKYIVPNLRFKWPKELEPFSDKEIAEAYDIFAMSEDFGNDDEKFLLWLPIMETVKTARDELTAPKAQR